MITQAIRSLSKGKVTDSQHLYRAENKEWKSIKGKGD